MSLLDALLLDAYRDPKEVWIALRTDAAKGSGTQGDPWNGATIPYGEIQISQISCSGITATIVTNGSHGFAEDDWVTVLGAELLNRKSGDLYTNSGDVYYTGTFKVHVLNSTSFQYTMRAVPASSSLNLQNLQITMTCVREREQFDTIMRNMDPGTRVHVGPGVFDTKGLNWNVVNWEPPPGQTLAGSGIAITTLKLVGAEQPEVPYWAVGVHYYTYVHDFTISDLTVDCNVSGQRTQFVACGAVMLPGKHIRIRGIRAINFGSHTNGYIENFVIVSGGTHPNLLDQGHEGAHCIIEDCIAEQPSPNAFNNSNIFALFGGERTTDGVPSYHRASVIRNCYANAEIIYGPVVPIQNIEYAAGIATITTVGPHLHVKPGNVVVRGAAVGFNLNNAYNGVFAIHSIDPDHDNKLSYILTTNPGESASGGTIGGGVSSHPIQIQSISLVSGTQQYKIKTKQPHFRTTNNNVKVWGVAPVQYNGGYNGVYPVDDYDPLHPDELIYTPSTPTGSIQDYTSVFLGVGHIALTGDAGRAAVVEGNRIYHCANGGPYHDTWSTPDLLIRNNSYHDVIKGPDQQLGILSYTDDATVLNYLEFTPIGPDYYAIATTDAAHGFSANDYLYISGVSTDDIYNGRKQVYSVPDPFTFTYLLGQRMPIGPGTGGRYNTDDKQRPLATLTYSTVGNKYLATAMTTYASHGLSVGEFVYISKAGHSAYPNSGVYNGFFRVSATGPTAKEFQYELPSDPGVGWPGPPDGAFCSGYFGRLWQTSHLIIENNVIELVIRSLLSDLGRSTGFTTYGFLTAVPPYQIAQFVIRRNTIRNVNNATDPDMRARAIAMWRTENALIEGNIIALDSPKPIEYYDPIVGYTANNFTSAGQPLLVLNALTQQELPDLGSLIEDTSLLASL